MKQIFQNLSTGETELAEVPCPQVKPGCLLIQSRASLVSIGTERMVLEFGKASLIEKAMQKPDQVKQVLEKIKADGLLATAQAVQSKLDKPVALGYSNAGVVLQVGDGVSGFSAGDRVISNGPHAEVVCVPKNLCAKIPDLVDDEVAPFTVIASIALQGVRLIQPTLGERIVVIGLGLVGLLTVQILQAHGCRVLGIDFNNDKLKLAESLGAETVHLDIGEDPVASGLSFSSGRGVDGVLITAATQSNEPVHQAAQMCRKRGRIVLVGVTGLELQRNDFYEKELTFQVSSSYGPGRYDPEYEERGMDYPFGFVRWTEQRNFQAVLEMMASGRLQTKILITQRFPFDQALKAYQLIHESQSPLGILLQHPEPDQIRWEIIMSPTVILKKVTGNTNSTSNPITGLVAAMIGAGGFATAVLLPCLRKTGVRLKTIASLGGLNGMHAGRKFGFENTTTDLDSIINDPEINTVFITTRHDNHADLVCRVLKSGKHVFVEKPLALNPKQLRQIIEVYEATGRQNVPLILLAGFNRRFSPQVIKMKSLLETVKEPKSMIMTVNAGAIPAKHWVQDPQIGGGRIIGEGCHFIDLLRFLAGFPIQTIQATQIESKQDCADNATFTMTFTDGSMGTVHYFANGHKSFPKERLEVFGAGRILRLDNFQTLTGYGWPNFKRLHLWRQDKGHFGELTTFIKAVQTGTASPIPFPELIEVTEASFKVVDLLR
jgi:predicted dehydrogenase/threonine dehydrogenase-like Zn-dependent dehydrogenase